MTVRLFRGLIVVSLLLGLAGVLVDEMFASLLPASLHDALDDLPRPMWTDSVWGWVWFGGLVLLLLIVGVVGTIGLFMLRRWGRTASLWLTFLLMLLSVWAGPHALSGVGWALYDASLILWGAVLAGAYWSPLAARFERA